MVLQEETKIVQSNKAVKEIKKAPKEEKPEIKHKIVWASRIKEPWKFERWRTGMHKLSKSRKLRKVKE